MSGLCFALLACSKPSAGVADAAPAVSASAAPRADTFLVDIAGFDGGAIEVGPEFRRRVYTRGTVKITLTLGQMGNMRLDDWRRTTQKFGYPIAALDVPDTEALGFYDCDDGGAKCDMHVHTSGGWHVEVQSGGTASRLDLEGFVSGLSFRGLSRR